MYPWPWTKVAADNRAALYESFIVVVRALSSLVLCKLVETLLGSKAACP